MKNGGVINILPIYTSSTPYPYFQCNTITDADGRFKLLIIIYNTNIIILYNICQLLISTPNAIIWFQHINIWLCYFSPVFFFLNPVGISCVINKHISWNLEYYRQFVSKADTVTTFSVLSVILLLLYPPLMSDCLRAHF